MIGLSEGSFVELQVVVRHLGLLLDVFVLELLQVRAYCSEVIHYGHNL